MPRATELVEWKCWSQGSEVQAAKRTNGVSASQRMPRRAEVVGLLVVVSRGKSSTTAMFSVGESKIEWKENVRLLVKEEEESPLH
jgi:hypothetical protein